jgi:hypothetical protein
MNNLNFTFTDGEVCLEICWHSPDSSGIVQKETRDDSKDCSDDSQGNILGGKI